MVKIHPFTRVLHSSSKFHVAASLRTKKGRRPEVKRKKKKKVLSDKTGAHLVSPQFFNSVSEYNTFFTKFADFKEFTSAMFTFTTITHKTSDTSHPLVMLTNREGFRYLFGKIPEGTQRVLNEERIRLGKLRGIFLTGILLSWSQIGGLPGLFLTVSDATKKDIDLYSNSSGLLTYLVSTWRYFVFRKGVQMNIKDTTTAEFIADSTVLVKPIRTASSRQSEVPATPLGIVPSLKKLMSLMFPSDTSAVNDPDPASYKSDPSETEIHTHVKLPDPHALSLVQNQLAINYLIRFLPIRGKFDPVKAKALGIKPGIDFRKLTQGSTVYNESGEPVYPEQVIEPSKHFSKALILDIPDPSYLHTAINTNDWFEKNEEVGEETIGIVYHFLGDDIDIGLEAYRDLLQKFPSNCKHIVSHSKFDKDVLVFKSAAENLLKLKSLQSECYNLPYVADSNQSIPLEGIFRLHQQQQVVVKPDEITNNYRQDLNETWESIYDSVSTQGSFRLPEKSQLLSSEPIPFNSSNTSLRDKVQVYTLGTGSALPSIPRNVISTLVRIPYSLGDKVEFRTMILDGGENTLGTINRMFRHGDGSKLQQIFLELSLIHLSHLHADHHLGLVSIINEWFKHNKSTAKKLYLILPWQYNHFLSEWYRLEEYFSADVDINRLKYLSCEEFLRDRAPEYKQFSIQEFEEQFDRKDLKKLIAKEPLAPRSTALIEELYAELKLVKVSTVRAIHCYWSYSISLEFKLDPTETFKISYSGDTRPNPKFVDIGYSSDLLIHESSLDHELIEEALAKKHSTMIEAIEMSRLMNCGHVILTHFSTRYCGSANFVSDQASLENLSEQLRNYLLSTGATPNIFEYGLRSERPTKSFEDVVVCFAFDMMVVNLRSMAKQKDSIKEIMEIFQSDEPEADGENQPKGAKEAKKKEEKQELKRLQRLALSSQKKRRVNDEEV